MVDWSTCPPSAGPSRDAWILEAVQAGEGEYTFVEIAISDDANNELVVRVFAEMLKLGGVRINNSARLQQQIADALYCRLMTARISDLAWLCRVMTLPPYTDSAVPTSTSAMVSKSKNIDTQIVAAGGAPAGIIYTEGKDWLIDNVLLQRTGKAANYGWHFVGATLWGNSFSASASIPNQRVIQPVSTAHDPDHVDYSQCCRLVSRWCRYNGVWMDLDVVLQDPNLSKLVSVQGVLNVLRQPGVTEIAPVVSTDSPSEEEVSQTPRVAAIFGKRKK